MPAKFPHYIDITATTVVKLQLVAESYSTGLLTDLGITKGTGTTGEVPQGKTLIGSGRLAAAQRGCFGVNLVYPATPTRNQTAKVMVSPTKADSVFIDAVGSAYRSKDVIEVRVPKRRTYTF